MLSQNHNRNIVRVIPVIHVQTLEQVRKNVKICLSLGVKQVFLISMEGNDVETARCFSILKKENPYLWIGCNFLDMGAISALKMEDIYQGEPLVKFPKEMNGLWSDRTLTSERLSKEERKYLGVFFGGFAFKYQKQPEDLAMACFDAVKCIDVITTSGEATGKAPNVKKIETIRQNIGDHALAIASGISSENIRDYLGLTDYALVASSITNLNDREELINPKKLENLLIKARN